MATGVSDAEAPAEAVPPPLGEKKGLLLAARLAVSVGDRENGSVGAAEGVCKALSREEALGEASGDGEADCAPDSVAAGECVSMQVGAGEAVSGAVGAAVADGGGVSDAPAEAPADCEPERDARGGADSAPLGEAAAEPEGGAELAAEGDPEAE